MTYHKGFCKKDVMTLGIFDIDEKELANYIKEISSGNEEALEQFYNTYGRAILTLIHSVVKSNDSAEEVLQDVLMAIVNRNTDRSVRNAKYWLLKVIQDISKKKAMEDALLRSELLAENEDISYNSNISEKIENGIDQIDALKYLDELEQQCVIMCVFWRLKLTQVAEVMGMPYKRVRFVYYYAIKKLRKYYEERNDKA